ncbi:hypothetical protein HYU13_01125 [Candidatus Woesearchaeota archaeon]|nr:hypothetical protein [Candidatus Woesearchaeota archaeon]
MLLKNDKKKLIEFKLKRPVKRLGEKPMGRLMRKPTKKAGISIDSLRKKFSNYTIRAIMGKMEKESLISIRKRRVFLP